MKKSINKVLTKAFSLVVVILTLSNLLVNTKVFGQEKVVIEYWHQNGAAGGELQTTFAEEFNASQDKYEVRERFISGSYQGLMQNLQASLAAGDAPSMVHVGWQYKEYFMNNFPYANPFELVEKYSTDKDFIGTKYIEEVLNLANNKSGELGGFPYGLSQPILYLNLDILTEAGINEDQLDTWPEVWEAANTIALNTDKNGIFITELAYTWEVQQMIESNGGRYMNAEGQVTYASDEAKEAWQYYADAVLENKSAIHMTGEEGRLAFMNGEVGMMFSSVAFSDLVSSTGLNLSALPAPQWEGKEYRVPAGGNFIAVTAQTEEEKEAVMAYLEFIYQPENIFRFIDATGYIPPTKDAEQENEDVKSLIENNVFISSAYKSVDSAISWFSWPGQKGLEAEQVLIDMRDQILNGELSVDEALENAEIEISELVK